MFNCTIQSECIIAFNMFAMIFSFDSPCVSIDNTIQNYSCLSGYKLLLTTACLPFDCVRMYFEPVPVDAFPCFDRSTFCSMDNM